MKKGITISTLTITVVIMLILVSVSSVAGISAIRTAAFEEFLSKLTRVANDVNLYVRKNDELPIKNEIVAKEGLPTEFTELLINNGDLNNELYVINMNLLKTETVNIGYGTTDNLDVFLVAQKTNNIYYLKGYQNKGETYYGNKGPWNASLGDLVKSGKDYGRTINYKANGITDWKVFYETDDYVYLIASEHLLFSQMPTNITRSTVVKNVVTINGVEKELGSIYWASGSSFPAATIQNPTLWMANWNDYTLNIASRCVSYFLDETYWTEFKNTQDYGDYVVGAIGTPTAEMFIASWNQKREDTGNTTIYANKYILSVNEDGSGYTRTSSPVAGNIALTPTDTLYTWTSENATTWLASPAGEYVIMLVVYTAHLSSDSFNQSYGLRPVICLRSDIPAKYGSTTYYEI